MNALLDKIVPTLKWESWTIDHQLEILNSFSVQLPEASGSIECQGFEIQFLSAWSTADSMMDHTHRLLAFSDDQKETSVQKIQEALKIIERTSPAVVAFVQNFTHRIDLINAPTYGIGSTSTGNQILRTIFRNISSPEMTSLDVAEGLVHESIHNYLNIIELKFPIFLSNVHRDFIWSKWTGNRIDFNSLPHACFVWFGLSYFFGLLENQKDLQIERHQIRCLHGFLQGGDLLSQLGNGFHDIDPAYQSMIQEIQVEARNDFFWINRRSPGTETFRTFLNQAGGLT